MPAEYTLDDEDAFLYGDEDEEVPATEASAVAPTSNGYSGTMEEAGDGEDEGDEEEEESDDDLEIIIDTEDGVEPVPPPMRRPVAPRPVAPIPIVAQKAVAESARASSLTPGVQTPILASDSPAPEAAEGLIREPEVAPAGLVPLGSLIPLSALPAADLHANIDVDAVQKDANGNDLFDIDIDSLEDKPWRRPGANMADYFNYGMNEQAWKNYALKQRRTRLTESAENNPFAAFASGDLREAWQNLAPEFKAVMMATIMGYQPGGPMPPGLMGMMGGGMPGGGMSGGMQGGMGMMGGMTGMQGMQGMGGYGMGMAGMQPAMGGMAGPQGMNGMPGGFLTAAHGGAEAFAGVAGPSTPLHGAQAGASEGQVDGEYPSHLAGANGDATADGHDPAAFADEAMDAEPIPIPEPIDTTVPANAPTGPRGARGRAPPARGGAFAARGRGVVAAGASGPPPTGPRAASALPANIPTGPRKQVVAPLRRDRSGYQDKDRQERAADSGLDYGASAKDASPSRQRESLPISRGGGADDDEDDHRSHRSSRRDRDRDEPRESRDSRRDDRDHRDRHRDWDDREREGSTDSKDRRERREDRRERERDREHRSSRETKAEAGGDTPSRDSPSEEKPRRERERSSRVEDDKVPRAPRFTESAGTARSADRWTSSSRRSSREDDVADEVKQEVDAPMLKIKGARSARSPEGSASLNSPEAERGDDRRRRSRRDDELEEEERSSRKSRKHHWDDEDDERPSKTRSSRHADDEVSPSGDEAPRKRKAEEEGDDRERRSSRRTTRTAA